MRNNLNNNNSITIIIGVVLISLIICVCIIIFGNNDDEKPKDDKINNIESYRFGKTYKDPNGVEIVLDTLSADHCVDNICLSITKISCNDSRGMVYFKLTNTGSSKTSGIAHVKFPENEISILYKNVDIGSTYESSYLYEDANLKQVTDFELSIK